MLYVSPNSTFEISVFPNGEIPITSLLISKVPSVINVSSISKKPFLLLSIKLIKVTFPLEISSSFSSICPSLSYTFNDTLSPVCKFSFSIFTISSS